MKGLISFALIGLVVWAIVTPNYQIKRRILFFYLFLTGIGVFAFLSKFGFTKGVGGIIGTMLPIGIAGYFLYRIRNILTPLPQSFKSNAVTGGISNRPTSRSVTKSLLRFGVIGETAKVCGQAYNLTYVSDLSHEEKLSFILNQRASVLIVQNTEGCLINADTIPVILGGCHNDLPFMVIQMMFYETPKFRSNILTSISNANEVIEVVYEVINEVAPHSTRLSFNELQIKSLHFLKTMHQVL